MHRAFHPACAARRWRAAAWGLLAAASLLATGAQAQPASRTPLVELNAGIHLIHAELADNDGTRQRGLMFRRELEPNHGMLFVFDDADKHCMWMRNTWIALSVAFIADDGTIVNVEEMQPQTDATHCARKPVRYALEMGEAWFRKRGLGSGTTLQGLAKAVGH